MKLKKDYKCVLSLEQFYRGGPYVVASDGSFLVCGCYDTIKVVDLSKDAAVMIKSTIEGDSEPVTGLALSPNDNIMLSSTRQIRVWDLTTLKCLGFGKGHKGPVMAKASDASGGFWATSGADGKVYVWDVDMGFLTHYFEGHKGVVTCIMFHPDPERLRLFSGGDDGSVRVWGLTQKKCLAEIEKHQSTVTSMAISDDGWTLISTGRDKACSAFTYLFLSR